MNPAIRNLRNLTRPFDRPLHDAPMTGCNAIRLVLMLESMLIKGLVEKEHEGHARIAVMVLKEPFPRNEMHCNCQPIAYQFTAEEMLAMRKAITTMCATIGEKLDQMPVELQQMQLDYADKLRSIYKLVRTPVMEGGEG